jgi:cytochrome c biogenesis protein CcmG/thiol:disulfide interchange protein DsbE
MDTVLRIGPFMLALDRAIALAAIWAFLAMGTAISTRTGTPASRATWAATGVGLVAARAGYVAANWPAFAIEPWTILAFWQGGFAIWPGIAAAAVTLLALLRASRAAAAGIAALAVLALLWTGAAQTLLRTPATPLPTGLQLVTLDGRLLDLDAMKGRPFVVNLWATWCPPCRREMPMLTDVARGSSIAVLLANQGEPPGQVRAFLDRQGLPADAVRLDIASRVGAATGSKALPTTLFIDAGGMIRSIHHGEISRAALTAGISDLERRPG